MIIREVNESDLDGLLNLYTQLHDNPIPEDSRSLSELWKCILQDTNHHIIVAVEAGAVVSSCVLIIVPNLTHGQKSYAFVENVITDKSFRNNGLATACLNCAREIAKQHRCYKIMLMTGSKEDRTLNFYRRAGYNAEDKTAFIQWL